MLSLAVRTSRALLLLIAFTLPVAFVACQKGDDNGAIVEHNEPNPSDLNDVTNNPNSANGNMQTGLQPNAISNVKPIAWPSLGFINNPGGKDAKAIALSFDDAPDGSGQNIYGTAPPSNMSHVLDQLDALKLKATFFICGKKWCDAKNDTQAQADVQRMLAAGHAIGSHTNEHLDLCPDTARNRAGIANGNVKMTVLTGAQIKAQFVDNEATFADAKLLGPSRLPFTMYRVPYGYPFQDGIVYPANEQSIVEDVTGVAPYTPYNAVHVGWGIDSRDWDCADKFKDSPSRISCILGHVKTFLDGGASGVILMHAVYKETGDALPQIIQMIQDHNMHIVQVEDLIKDKYGATSAEIYSANVQNPTPFDTATINAAAVSEAKQSKWYTQKNEG